MSTLRDQDAVIGVWLDDGPQTLPVETRQAITVGIRTITRRPATGWSLPRFRLPTIEPRRLSMALGSAAVVVVVAALALSLYVNRQGGIGASPSPTLSASPTVVASPSVQPTAIVGSGGMWPQSTLEEVLAAQERADAGDPNYTWQLDAQIANGNSPNAEIVARFVHEELGWEEYIFNPSVGWERAESNLTYMKCAAGETNSIYPEDEDAGQCAPTIDEFQYETVSIDLAQPIRSDPTGIWVVTRWAMIAPFGQSDPRVIEAGAIARLEEFLEARIAGEGAEGYVEMFGGQRYFGTLDEVPLLYGTSTGAAYERYEIDVAGGPRWPYGDLDFDVRLFGDGDGTVVEQPFTWRYSRLYQDVTQTKENGQPVALDFAFFDGEVILTAARPWEGGFERDSLDLIGRVDEAIVLVGDPLSAATGCEHGPAPVDADALARSLESDPDLQVTAPVAVSVGGVDGLQMDVVLAPGASDCEGWSVLRRGDGSDRRGANVDRGSRMRVYLFDMPEGSSMRILAIAVVAPEARFETVMNAATPVLESIAFPARDASASPSMFIERFTSTIHGISIDYPSGWQARPATESWNNDSFTFDAPGVDVIFDPAFQDDLYLSLASKPLGTQSAEDWYAGLWAAAEVCEGGGNYGRITVDGAEASIRGCDGSANRFEHHVVQVATATHGYVIYLHVAEDPILQAIYTERWFDAVLETVDLP